MRIFTQSITNIVPVFVALSVISGTVMYLQLLRESRWGLEQAAKAYSIATAEYTDPIAYQPLAENSSADALKNEAARAELNLFIRRLVSHAKVRAVYAWEADGVTVIDSASTSDEPSPHATRKRPKGKATFAPTPTISFRPGPRGAAGTPALVDASTDSATQQYDDDYTVPPPSLEIRGELAEHGYYVGRIETLGEDSGRIIAYALVLPPKKTASGIPPPTTPPTPPDTHAGGGNEASAASVSEDTLPALPAGFVGVNVDASDYVVQMRVQLERVIGIAAAITAIGFLLATMISRLIVRDIRSLSAGAAAIARGELDQTVTSARIQELSDLGGTFNIMVEILQNVVAKTRRSLLEGELFRTESELAQAFADHYRPPISQELPGDMRVIASFCGDHAIAARSFYDVVVNAPDKDRDAKSGWAFVGSVDIGKDLDAAMTASAAALYIKRHLTTLNLSDVVGEPTDTNGEGGAVGQLFSYAAELFGTRCLMVCGWNVERSQACIWRFDHRESSPVNSSAADALPERDTVNVYELTPNGSPILLHDFDVPLGEQLARYTHFFADLPLGELLNDIQRIVLPVGQNGAVLMLRRESGTASPVAATSDSPDNIE